MFFITLLILLLLALVFLVVEWANIEQRKYISKVLPVLHGVSSPDDKRLSALKGTDYLGFTTTFSSTKLADGWVVILDRLYIADEDPVCLREFLEHRIIIFRDSEGRIYVKSQGLFPTDDINNKGLNDYKPNEDITVTAFFNREKKFTEQGLNFFEVKQ